MIAAFFFGFHWETWSADLILSVAFLLTGGHQTLEQVLELLSGLYIHILRRKGTHDYCTEPDHDEERSHRSFASELRLRAHISTGEHRTIVGAIGDERVLDEVPFEIADPG